MKEIFKRLIVEAPFKYIQQVRQHAYSTIVFNIFMELESHQHFFNLEGKVTSNIKLLKLRKANSKKYLYYLLLFLPVYHFVGKRFYYLADGSVLKSYFSLQR